MNLLGVDRGWLLVELPTDENAMQIHWILMKAKVAPNCSEFNDFTAEANYSDKLRGKLAVGLIILLKGSTNTVGGVGVARKSKSKMITKMFTFS